jgi:pre-rRNA-processing protein RIX1
LAPSVRAEIDRTIILTANKDAMLASVLNPIPAAKGRGAGSSLIPFLVRGYSDEMEVEALVRPRMPVLMTAPELDAYAEMEEDEEADEMADEPFNAPSQSASFLTQPAATSVETQKTEPSAASAVPLHKRTYFEETSAELHSSPTSEKQPVQVKKARFEEKVQTPASVPAYRPTKVEASMVPKQVPATSQAPATQATSSVTAEALPVDDSDDELPALNIDPDTDDEDDDEEDDEDVAMEG